jgi:AsmA protein
VWGRGGDESFRRKLLSTTLAKFAVLSETRDNFDGGLSAEAVMAKFERNEIKSTAIKLAQDRRVQVAGGAVVVVLLAMALLPLFVDGSKYVPEIEQQLTTSLGRQVTLGKLSLNLFAGGLSADSLTIADDAAYSTQPFLQSKQLKVGVELMPLLLRKELHVKKLSIVHPQIQMIQNADGKWNFSTIGTTAAKSNSSGASEQNSQLQVDTLEVHNAKLTVQTTGAASAHVFDKVEASVKNFSFTSPFSVTMSAALPAGGTMKLTGTAGPIDATDNTLTPLEADVTLTHLDPVGAGFLSAQGGVDGVLDVVAHLQNDGKTVSLTGKVTGDKMKFAAKGTPSSQTVTVDFLTTYSLATREGIVNKGDVHAGGVSATVTGNYAMKPSGTEIEMDLNAPGMNVDAVQTLLPAFGVSLPKGSGLKGGTLSTELKITGAVGKLTITGPVDLKNSSLDGFNLSSKLGSLPMVKSSGGNATTIQSLHADIVMTPTELQTNNIDAVIPPLGSATGAGVIYPDNTLNYKLDAKINGFGQLLGGLSSLLGAKNTYAGGIPLIIKGTTQNPSFSLNMGNVGKDVGAGGNSTASKLKGLFGR